MDIRVETAITKFLRTCLEPFKAEDIAAILKSFGLKVTREDKEDIYAFLDEDERVFPLKNRFYRTRAGAFTGVFFSFVPTQQELDQEAFVPGDRCMPFVDCERHSSQLKFEYGGHFLPKTVIETDCNTARDIFALYGEEYSTQYISADPVNQEMHFANNNFELPPKVKLTGFSISRILKDFNFKKGDRFLCRVNDWDKGIIEIFPIVRHNKNPFALSAEMSEREQWNKIFEEALLSCMKKMGPGPSIEQQLAYTFYDFRELLCSPECGSVHECLKESDKIGIELFGVETRLWKKGENVPAVGEWNKDYYTGREDSPVPFYNFPDFLMDCLIKDQFFEKKEDYSRIIKQLFPYSRPFSPEEEQFFTLQIMSRSAILREHYNWFADFGYGDLRHKALDLYSKVWELVYEVDCVGAQLEGFPQQELVILSQLFSHISRILELFASGQDCGDDERTAIKMSLEGMEYNFEDIRAQLRAAVDKFRAGQFKVI